MPARDCSDGRDDLSGHQLFISAWAITKVPHRIGGIGLETSQQLAQAGVHVLLAGRSLASSTKAAEDLRAEGLSVDSLALDVTDPASWATGQLHPSDKT